MCTNCNKRKDDSQYSFRNKKENLLHQQCKMCMKEKIQKHYYKNAEKYKKRIKKWAEDNPEKRAKNVRNSYAINKGYTRCKCCKIEDINTFLSECPVDCHVDHIQNVKQGGKHCLKNLRYLKISDHCRKSQWERYNT